MKKLIVLVVAVLGLGLSSFSQSEASYSKIVENYQSPPQSDEDEGVSQRFIDRYERAFFKDGDIGKAILGIIFLFGLWLIFFMVVYLVVALLESLYSAVKFAGRPKIQRQGTVREKRSEVMREVVEDLSDSKVKDQVIHLPQTAFGSREFFPGSYSLLVVFPEATPEWLEVDKKFYKKTKVGAEIISQHQEPRFGKKKNIIFIARYEVKK